MYVEDVYFRVQESTRPLTLIDDPTPEIRREQNAFVSSLLVDPDLTASDYDVLEAVVDGGQSVDEVEAERSGQKERSTACSSVSMACSRSRTVR